MRGADNPMQAIRWSHVNTAFEQQVYEAGITGGINIGTVIAVVVNRVAISEVDLEHRPKALNDCPRLSPAEHFAQTRNRGIPQRMRSRIARGPATAPTGNPAPRAFPNVLRSG